MVRIVVFSSVFFLPFWDWNDLISLMDLGFLTVPITMIASTKKVKALVNNIHMLTQAIRSSSKLVSILD